MGYFDGMNIFILRHGIAVERGTPGFENDSQRPLTPKGKRQLRKTAAAMKKMDMSFDLILSSPHERAKRTAKIIAENLKLKRRLKFSDALKPDGDVKILIRQLNELEPAPENILLAGHEPHLSRLISLLVTGDTQLQVDFKKGALCKLEIEKLRASQCAQLAWLLTPRQMKLMV
jgi:phosphohistidine phosphatase